MENFDDVFLHFACHYFFNRFLPNSVSNKISFSSEVIVTLTEIIIKIIEIIIEIIER